ncbi:MAG: hypothetical protein JSR48_15200 [Verrucomicrobia bacterium]|nr:hypothetical protein [Verrucomicrobiota bacterium]
MTSLPSALAVFALLAGTALSAAPAHDLYLCAAINKNYVIGSKLVTLNGLYRRQPDGTFQHLGSNFTGLFALTADPRNPQVCYAATLNGAMSSRNGGERWRVATSWDMTEPKDICLDPNAPDHIYLALPDGVAVSPDAGATWPRREQGLPDRGKYTQTIEVDRTQAGRVLAGCESGIYLTEDGAANWRRVLPTSATVDDIQQSPHDPRRWLAVTQSDGAFESRDGGCTWQKLAAVPAAEALYNVAFDPTNPQRLAIASWHYGLLVSEDGGRTWTARTAGLPPEDHLFRVGIDPDDGRLYLSFYQGTIHVSSDFGRTWQTAGLEGSTVYDFVFVPRKGQ